MFLKKRGGNKDRSRDRDKGRKGRSVGGGERETERENIFIMWAFLLCLRLLILDNIY